MNRLLFLITISFFCLCASAAPPSTDSVDSPETAPAESSDSDEPRSTSSSEDVSVKPVSEAIVVTATRSERGVNELPVSVLIVDEEEIESAPALSIDDLIRGLPGVTPSVISSAGSTGSNQRFSMHGLGGIRALVLLDGIPLHDPYSGVIQWQNVPLQSLRQIEVVRGGNASLFGNHALGGTVNLITKPLTSNELSLDLSYGSHDTRRGSLTFDSVLNEAVAVRLSHYETDSDGYRRVPDPGPIDIDAWVDRSITTGRADFNISDTSRASITGSTSEIDSSRGTPVTASLNDVQVFSGSFHQIVGNGSLISVNAYRQDQSEFLVNSRIIGDGEDEYKTQEGIIDSTGTGASLEWSHQREGAITSISAGLDFQELEAWEDRVSFARSGGVTNEQKVGGRQQFTGLFAQMSWRPTGDLEVLGSARTDWFVNDKGATLIVGGPEEYYEDTSSRQFNPRLSVRYALGERSVIRAAAYRAFNAPTLRELYRNSQTGNSTLLGNPDLVPEILVGGELSWEWVGQLSRLQVHLYRSEIDGVQSRVESDSDPNVYFYKNLGTARSQGVELTGDFRLSRHLSVSGAYTFADSVITEDPNRELVGNWAIEVPRHSGSVSLRYISDGGTRAELRALALGRSYSDADNLALSPGHEVVDLSFSRPIRSGLDGYVVVENVFDEGYYLALARTSFRSGLPRTITLGIRLKDLRWRRDR